MTAGGGSTCATPSKEGGAKSIKALNHKGQKGKEKLYFVLFVSFVVPFFSEPFATISFGHEPLQTNANRNLWAMLRYKLRHKFMFQTLLRSETCFPCPGASICCTLKNINVY